jgi:hypothetical protein
MWKMKFETDMMMKGHCTAFQPEFDAELSIKEKMAFNLADDKEKNQHDTVKMNQKTRGQFALSFNNVSLLNKLNCKKHRDKTNWPTGKAHHFMWVIVNKQYKPEDTMAKMEMKRAPANGKVEARAQQGPKRFAK